MNAAVIVGVTFGVVLVAFLVWAWVMNRWDEREQRRMTEDMREPPVLGDPPRPGRSWWT